MVDQTSLASRRSLSVLLAGPLLALELLTVLRLRRPPLVADDAFGRCQAWFPAVGVALGGCLAGLAALLDGYFGPQLLGWLLVGALALLSGGLHVDGLGDTVDGLCGGHDREQRLAIMRDGSVGVLGAAAVFIVLATKATAFGTLASDHVEALVLAPTLARWAAVCCIAAFPYARGSGLGLAFHRAAFPWPAPLATAIAMLAALSLAGWAGLMLVGVAGLTGLALGATASRALGGVTGDVYGAMVEVSEAAVALAFIVLAAEGAVS